MELKPRLLDLASRLLGRERDPARAEDIWRRFDEDHHYADYLAQCQAQFRRDPPPQADARLAQRGYTYLRALDPQAANEAAAGLAQHSGLQLLKKDDRNLEGFRVEDRPWLAGLLGQILQGPVDERIAGFFGSEYLVHWVTFSLTRQAPEQPIVSFKWHCDKGPSAHLKLIVYLNPTADHGGNTEFMDLDDTLAVARQGYLFGWSKTRTGDVAHHQRHALGQHALVEHRLGAHPHGLAAEYRIARPRRAAIEHHGALADPARQPRTGILWQRGRQGLVQALAARAGGELQLVLDRGR